MDLHCIGFIRHLLIGVFDLINFCTLNWSVNEMVICQNDPQPEDLGGFLFYKGHMITVTIVITQESKNCICLDFNVAMVTKMSTKIGLK